MTNPQIGNTGVNLGKFGNKVRDFVECNAKSFFLNTLILLLITDDEESEQCFLAGLVIRSLSISTSNWRCTKTLADYLTERNLMGVCKFPCGLLLLHNAFL